MLNIRTFVKLAVSSLLLITCLSAQAAPQQANPHNQAGAQQQLAYWDDSSWDGSRRGGSSWDGPRGSQRCWVVPGRWFRGEWVRPHRVCRYNRGYWIGRHSRCARMNRFGECVRWRSMDGGWGRGGWY